VGIRSVWRHITGHCKQVTLLAIATIVGQIAVLSQHPLAVLNGDVPSYLVAARHIYAGSTIFDPTRTPGYPALLAIVFHIAGWGNFGAVAIVQTLLMMLAIGEFYGLAAWLLRSAWAASITASLLALNLYLLDWERTILSEGPATWLTITIACVLARYLVTNRVVLLAWLGALLALSIAVRPFFIYLPLVVAIALIARALRTQMPWRRWAWIALVPALAYGAVAVTIIGNAVTYGYRGLSTVGTVNLFGKVLEYHLQDATVDPRYDALRGDLHAYIAQHGTEPWGFGDRYPQYKQDYYAPLQTYSTSIILHNPLAYAAGTAGDALATLTASPSLYAPFEQHLPLWVAALFRISQIELLVGLALPLALALCAVMAWRRPHDERWQAMLVLTAAAAGGVLIAAGGSYAFEQGSLAMGQFYRMRSPFDWVMILVTTQGARMLLGRAYERRKISRRAALREEALVA
jgi:hypothetical protein